MTETDGKEKPEPNLEHLQQIQNNLTNALRLESDPANQAELLQKLSANRQQIARLTGAKNAPPTNPPDERREQPNEGAPRANPQRAAPAGRINLEPASDYGPQTNQAAGHADASPAIGNQSNPARPRPAMSSGGRNSPSRAKRGPASSKALTSVTVVAIAAMLTAIAITWILVAKPGNNSDTSAVNDGSAQGPTDADPNALTPEAQERTAAYQSELNRIVAAGPIIFEPNSVDLSDLHKRTLDKISAAMTEYPDLPVKVLGFTDPAGEVESNKQISLQRAESVKAYLVSKGISDGILTVEARGEASSSGSQDLANLERKVEFEVQAVVSNADTLRVGIVAPSAANDLAFTQSIADAVKVISAERGNVQLEVTENLFEAGEAGLAIREYAAQDFDLVIAHGSEYGAQVQAIATEFPDVTFAWGTAAETFGLKNVYAYEAASEQGGYVLGAMSAALSQNKSIGIIGPIKVGDAERYVDGFTKGAAEEVPGVRIQVEYINSFADTQLAEESAVRQMAAGADVLSGTGEMVVGAIPVVQNNGGVWLGTQSSQAPLAPDRVAASQIYHWEIILRQIIKEVEAGKVSGRAFKADLENGGLRIEINPDYPLPANISDRSDQIVDAIKTGSITVLDG